MRATRRVDIAMSFEMKGGLFGWALGELVGKRRLRSRMTSFLRGLDHYLVTGEKVRP